MKKLLLVAVLASTALVLLHCSGGGGSKSSVSPTAQLLGLINKNRATKLVNDPAIAAVAKQYAKYLEQHYLPGSGPYAAGLDGQTVTSRLNNAGITNFSAAAETGFATGTASMAWAGMNQGTATNPAYTHGGVGAVICAV